MKMLIKSTFIFLMFFSTINYSYSQTITEDSLQQNEYIPEEATSNDLEIPGELTLTGDSSGLNTGQSYLSGSEESTGSENTSNEYINSVFEKNTNTSPAPERVRGTRLPNEYSSGRTGGQYSIPKPATPAKPKKTTPAPVNTAPPADIQETTDSIEDGE